MNPLALVPEDSQKQGFDVLNGRIGNRTNCIHVAMASINEPKFPADIGEVAQQVAESIGLQFNLRTYSETVTYNHLNTMRTRRFAERLPDGRWRLSETARSRIEHARTRKSFVDIRNTHKGEANVMETLTASKTDRQARLTLPDDFANLHVIVERVGTQELRIRKADLRPRKFSLSELLSNITDENRHAEISTGAAVGQEADE